MDNNTDKIISDLVGCKAYESLSSFINSASLNYRNNGFSSENECRVYLMDIYTYYSIKMYLKNRRISTKNKALYATKQEHPELFSIMAISSINGSYKDIAWKQLDDRIHITFL